MAERVRAGGHDVPESDIRRRFGRSIRNFWTMYRELADSWVLLYNGLTTLQDIAVGTGNHTAVRDSDLFATFLESCWCIAMIRSKLSAETYAASDEIVRIGNRGVAKAQERNRELGVPNAYSINGRLYYETSTGELSATDPFGTGQRATEPGGERAD